jgi:hypothetical protein
MDVVCIGIDDDTDLNLSNSAAQAELETPGGFMES